MTWDDHYMRLASLVALKSKDETKVGALLVSDDNIAILSAFNGPPRGVIDSPERFIRPTKYLYASHAEANLIYFAARKGIQTLGCTVYVTHMPCADCAKALIQSGIKRVIYGPGQTSMSSEHFSASRRMFCEAQVETAPSGSPSGPKSHSKT